MACGANRAEIFLTRHINAILGSHNFSVEFIISKKSFRLHLGIDQGQTKEECLVSP